MSLKNVPTPALIHLVITRLLAMFDLMWMTCLAFWLCIFQEPATPLAEAKKAQLISSLVVSDEFIDEYKDL